MLNEPGDTSWQARVRQTPEEAPKKATIMVTGCMDRVHEPLLLEALANHPDCERLYFASFQPESASKNYEMLLEDEKDYDAARNHGYGYNVQGVSFLFDAYDLTDMLKREHGPSRDGEALGVKLKEHMKSCPPETLSTDQVDMCVSGTNLSMIDRYIARRHPELYFVSPPSRALRAKNKANLPEIDKKMAQRSGGERLCTTSARVESVEDVKQFMQQHGFDQVVLKDPRSIAGKAVYRIFKEKENGAFLIEYDEKSSHEQSSKIEPFDDFSFPDRSMLAMKWLEPNKGDMRVVISHGKCVGAYLRYPKEGSWLANYAQGGSIAPVDLDNDLTPENKARVERMAKHFYDLTGVGIAGVDWLQDKQGMLHLSEINVNLTLDLNELHKHGDMGAADRVANDCMEAYRSRIQGIEQIMRNQGSFFNR